MWTWELFILLGDSIIKWLSFVQHTRTKTAILRDKEDGMRRPSMWLWCFKGYIRCLQSSEKEAEYLLLRGMWLNKKCFILSLRVSTLNLLRWVSDTSMFLQDTNAWWGTKAVFSHQMVPRSSILSHIRTEAAHFSTVDTFCPVPQIAAFLWFCSWHFYSVVFAIFLFLFTEDFVLL